MSGLLPSPPTRFVRTVPKDRFPKKWLIRKTSDLNVDNNFDTYEYHQRYSSQHRKMILCGQLFPFLKPSRVSKLIRPVCVWFWVENSYGVFLQVCNMNSWQARLCTGWTSLLVSWSDDFWTNVGFQRSPWRLNSECSHHIFVGLRYIVNWSGEPITHD